MCIGCVVFYFKVVAIVFDFEECLVDLECQLKMCALPEIFMYC